MNGYLTEELNEDAEDETTKKVTNLYTSRHYLHLYKPALKPTSITPLPNLSVEQFVSAWLTKQMQLLAWR
jgi:hypothetical protein